MKKLLIICVLLAIAFTTQAQDGKPTKEETVNFINRALESLKGSIYIGNKNISEFNFNETEIQLKFEGKIGNRIGITSYKYSLINWDKLYEIKYTSAQGRLEILLFFNANLKQEYSFNLLNDQKVEYLSHIQIPIPENKKESMEKAFLRLSEIAKEENKDPFED